jgi:hypothetical protein
LLSFSKENHSRPGKAGRDGKNGKMGKAAKGKAKRGDEAGHPGEVCFNVYDEHGLAESGGKPHRVVLSKLELKDQLRTPYSKIDSTLSKTDPMIFGETLSYGPVLPINIGCVFAPSSILWGTLMTILPNGAPLVLKGLLQYPKIPAADRLHDGKLQQSYAQTMLVSIPRISQIGFELPNSGWPWNWAWSQPVLSPANFGVEFTIGKYTVRDSITDGEHSAKRSKSIYYDATCTSYVHTHTCLHLRVVRITGNISLVLLPTLF